MPKPTMHRVVLTGPYAGQDIILNGYKFTGGVHEVIGTDEQVAGIFNYMAKSYRGYREGSDQLAAVQKADEARNGKRNISGNVQSVRNTVDSDVQSDGRRPAEESADVVSGHADAEAGSGGSVPGRDGYKDAGLPEEEIGQDGPVVPQNLELAKAILVLDPTNKEHWTAGGKPALAAVQHSYGSGDITRKDLSAAAPGWDREKAQEAKDLQDLAL